MFLKVVGVSIALIVQAPVVKSNVNMAAVLVSLGVVVVNDSFTVHVVTHAVVVANLRCCGSSCC